MSDDKKKGKDELLEELADLPERPPGPEEPSACCYDMAAEPTTEEHVCSACGARSQYPLGTALPDPAELRRRLPALPGWTLEIDDRELCSACAPAVSGAPAAPDEPAPRPALALVATRLSDGRTTRTRGIGLEDLEALRSFGARGLLAWLLPAPARVKKLLGL